VLVSIGTAYLVMQFASIMDYVQALFSFFIAPLFGTVLLGMLWKRATPGRRILGIAGGAGIYQLINPPANPGVVLFSIACQCVVGSGVAGRSYLLFAFAPNQA
jgi:Na+/proline symporter